MQMKPSQKSKKLQLIHLLFPLTSGKIKGISVLSTLLLLFGKKKKLSWSVTEGQIIIHFTPKNMESIIRLNGGAFHWFIRFSVPLIVCATVSSLTIRPLSEVQGRVIFNKEVLNNPYFH